MVKETPRLKEMNFEGIKKMNVLDWLLK